MKHIKTYNEFVNEGLSDIFDKNRYSFWEKDLTFSEKVFSLIFMPVEFVFNVLIELVIFAINPKEYVKDVKEKKKIDKQKDKVQEQIKKLIKTKDKKKYKKYVEFYSNLSEKELDLIVKIHKNLKELPEDKKEKYDSIILSNITDILSSSNSYDIMGKTTSKNIKYLLDHFDTNEKEMLQYTIDNYEKILEDNKYFGNPNTVKKFTFLNYQDIIDVIGMKYLGDGDYESGRMEMYDYAADKLGIEAWEEKMYEMIHFNLSKFYYGRIKDLYKRNKKDILKTIYDAEKIDVSNVSIKQINYE